MSAKAIRSLPVPPASQPETEALPAELTPKEKVILFQQWEKANILATQAQRALDEANEAKSKTAEAIARAMGPGAYTWKGHTRILTSRTNKETGKTTWFFKEPMTQDPEVIG